MQKYTNYILIAVILLGVLSPVFFSYAEPPTSPSTNSPYILLSPLPNPDKPGELMTSFDPSNNKEGTNTALGKYLNLMIKIFIGICAVLAMGMIILGGLEYMTSELVSSKESGKQKITGALLGLVLALGSWAILNTINPDLLNSDLKIKDVKIEVKLGIRTDLLQDDENDTTTPFTGVLPSGPVATCPGGVARSTSGMVVCGAMLTNINSMLATAQTAGFTIGGGGFRTYDQQMKLRRDNCGGNTTDDIAVCNPRTALPGFSRHESGAALDLTCNGARVARNTPCFTWLQNNAGKYGLINLRTGDEPWHWSNDGR